MTSNSWQTVQTIYKQSKYLALYQRTDSRPRDVPALEPWIDINLPSYACLETPNWILSP